MASGALRGREFAVNVIRNITAERLRLFQAGWWQPKQSFAVVKRVIVVHVAVRAGHHVARRCKLVEPVKATVEL